MKTSTMLGICVICAMAACMDPPATDDSGATGDDQAAASEQRTFTAADAPVLAQATEPAPSAQDCVYIQYCDEPPKGGTWMVVGKIRPACFSQCWNDALINEFVGDAKAVCGAHSLDDNKWRIECF